MGEKWGGPGDSRGAHTPDGMQVPQPCPEPLAGLSPATLWSSEGLVPPPLPPGSQPVAAEGQQPQTWLQLGLVLTPREAGQPRANQMRSRVPPPPGRLPDPPPLPLSDLSSGSGLRGWTEGQDTIGVPPRHMCPVQAGSEGSWEMVEWVSGLVGTGPQRSSLGRSSNGVRPLSLECPQHRFGASCEHRCACQHGGLCHPANGSCSCGLGWTGPHCELGECPAAGRWVRRGLRVGSQVP